MPETIVADSITKAFPGVIAVKQVTLRAKAGMNIVVGPNGAGKSTLLRCLGGLYRPDSGTVSVFRGDPYKDDALRSKISILSDNYALYDRLSVMSNLLFFGRLYDIPDAQIKKRSEQLLRKLDAYGYINRNAGELSRGTKQKVAICRALINDPKALILDEPTAFLDAISSERVHKTLEELASDGKTIIYATQRLNEATRFDAMLFVMKDGSISTRVGTKDLYNRELRGAIVNIRLASPISMALAKRIPGFKSLDGSIVKISIREYRDINKALKYLVNKGAYVISVDYTEQLVEGMLA